MTALMADPTNKADARSQRIIVCSDLADLSQRAARHFTELAIECVSKQGRFTVCLSGGSTPRQTYALLAQEPFCREIPWPGVHIFWGDERVVPSDQPDNHHRMASDLFLDKVPIPAENVHRMPVELETPAKAADQYEDALRSFFALKAGELPRFDLIILGMGADGHMASLFPGTEALRQDNRMVAANYNVPKLPPTRLTLTLPVLNEAREIMFLVSGHNKADALLGVLSVDDRRQSDLPAASLSLKNGEVLWMVDEDAAMRIKDSVIPSSEVLPQ